MPSESAAEIAEDEADAWVQLAWMPLHLEQETLPIREVRPYFAARPDPNAERRSYRTLITQGAGIRQIYPIVMPHRCTEDDGRDWIKRVEADRVKTLV
jgi:hypothetical protein